MKKIKLLCVALAFALLATSCGTSSADIATINGKSISKAQYCFYLMQGKNAAASAAYQQGNQISTDEDWEKVKIDDKTAEEYAKNEADKALMQTLVLVEKANELGVTFDEEDRETVNNNKNSLIEQVGGTYQFKKYLESAGIDEVTFDEELKNNVIAGKVYQKLSEEGDKYFKISDEDVSKNYTENYMAAKHILILTESSDAADGDESVQTDEETAEKEAKDKATEVLNKIKNGADFDTMMKEYTQDPGLEQSPDGYVFKSGDMVSEFEEAVKSLKVDEYTKELVQTSYGFHIIKRIALPTEGTDYENAISSIKTSLSFEQLNELTDKWAKEYNFKFNEKAKKKISIVNKDK